MLIPANIIADDSVIPCRRGSRLARGLGCRRVTPCTIGAGAGIISAGRLDGLNIPGRGILAVSAGTLLSRAVISGTAADGAAAPARRVAAAVMMNHCADDCCNNADGDSKGDPAENHVGT